MLETLNLNIDEKIVISDFVYSDVQTAAYSQGLEPLEVAYRITPARTAYFWIEPISNKILDNAFTAIQSNPKIKLTLTDWTSLIWMAENGVDKIISDREEIDKVLYDPEEVKNMPRIIDNLRNIRRI